MKNGIRPLVIGNWKMNPQSSLVAQKLITNIKKELKGIRDTEVVVAPPTLYLSTAEAVRGGSKSFTLGAQNVHHEKLGAFTGEVSIPMVRSFGVTHVILGHSERRAQGETDELINKKLHAVVQAGLVGVVCVGEEKRDQSGNYLNVIEAQIRSSLSKIAKAKLSSVVIAYETVWAIGTGQTATPNDVHEMKLFIEKVLTDIYGRSVAGHMRILYGGSVNLKNAIDLFREGAVAGFLVGGASLHPIEFKEIVRATNHG